MEKAKRALKAETPKQPSLHLRLSASHFYPDCGVVSKARSFGVRCCVKDGGRPFGAGLQEQASNDHRLLLPNGSGGERYGKGAGKLRHVWVRETNANEPL